MSFSLSSRALLRGMLAGAVVLTGTACSRTDHTESGRDNSATSIGADTTTAGYVEMARDTSDVPDQVDTGVAAPTYEAADETADEQVVRPEDR